MSTIFISHSSKDNDIARELERRLAEQNHHSVFLDLDPEKGIVAGQSWEQTLYRKLRACRAVLCLCTDSYLASHWCFAEVALARMEGKHLIALQVDPLGEDARLPAILMERQIIDLRENPEEGYRRLWNGLREEDILGESGEWRPERSPYLGLSAFQEEDAPVFFGREEETCAGIELVARGAPGLIMVLGASGSGKSSLVRAGMVPRLRRDPRQWLVITPFRPGADPFGELAARLDSALRRYAPEHAGKVGGKESIRQQLEAAAMRLSVEKAVETLPGDTATLGADERLSRLLKQLQDLKQDPPSAAGPRLKSFLDWSLEDLRRICGETADSGRTAGTGVTALTELAETLRRFSDVGQHARVLIVVDQFEELLGHEETTHPANPFLNLLRASIELEQSPLMVLGTMRSDFLSAFQRNDVLRGIDFESLSLGPMRPEGMRRVVEEPARLGAIELEAGLADRLLQDTETPDALPLLSFTLWKLWHSYRDDGKIEIHEYEDLGGLQGAIATEADQILKHARKQGQEDDLRLAFLKMARLSEDGSYARSPVPWTAPEVQQVASVLDRFLDSRLLLTRGDGENRTVEVAHEALFRSWQPLRNWLDDNRAELLLRRQLERAAEAWDGRDKEPLWAGGRLQQAREVLGEASLSPEERRFVEASVRKQRSRRLTLGVVTTIVMASILTFAVSAQRSAIQAQAAKTETIGTVMKFALRTFDESLESFDEAGEEWGESNIECGITRNTASFGVAKKSLFGLLCHVQDIVSLADMQRISGMKVFLSGPHHVDAGEYPLESGALDDFGHYNPEFVRWAVDNLIPSDDSFATAGPAERVYEQTLKEQMRILYQAHQDLHADPGFLAEMAQRYQSRIDAYQDTGQGYDSNSPGVYIQGLFSSYAAIRLRRAVGGGVLQDKPYLYREYYRYRMAAGFWLRREIDGTAPNFIDGLRKLVRAFDPEALDQTQGGSPLARTQEVLVGAWAGDDGQELIIEPGGTYRRGNDTGYWKLTGLDELTMDGIARKVQVSWYPLTNGYDMTTRVLLLRLDDERLERQ